MFLIYGLVDPRTKLVRYVGLSASGMTRPRGHRKTRELAKQNHKSAWIKSLFVLGLDYEVVVLEEITSRAALPAAERWWIAFGRACGWPLTNLTDGGDGAPGWRHSAVTREKMSADRKGRVFSDEHRARLSAAQQDKPRSPRQLAHLVRARAVAASKPISLETRAKLVDAANRRWTRR